MDDVNADAKGGFRRIEVLTGPARRRRWSTSEKAQIVAETLSPGASVSEVARRWQVCPQQVFTWRRDARAGVLAPPAQEPDLTGVGFVPLLSEMAESSDLSSAVQAPRPERSSRGAMTSSIEIKLAGAVIRVTSGADTTLLMEVLRAVRASAA